MLDTDAHTAPLLLRSRSSRRDFIKLAGVVAGGVLLVVGGRLRLTLQLPELPGETLMRSTFAGHRGARFTVPLESGATTLLQLVDLRDLPGVSQTPAQQEHSFSLLFRGPATQPLGQATYPFAHPRIGRFTLFIAPQAPDRDVRYYEAVFNRLPV